MRNSGTWYQETNEHTKLSKAYQSSDGWQFEVISYLHITANEMITGSSIVNSSIAITIALNGVHGK